VAYIRTGKNKNLPILILKRQRFYVMNIFNISRVLIVEHELKRREIMEISNYILNLKVLMLVVAVIAMCENAISQDEWVEVIGGQMQDVAYSMVEGVGGGYAICGVSYSFGNKDANIWLVKLNSVGSIDWQISIGGSDFDSCSSILKTTDGNYIILGSTWSYGAGSSDYIVAKISDQGEVLWSKVYGGNSYDFAHKIIESNDGGYIIIGRSWSFGASNGDVWLLKIDANGVIEWQKLYGGDKLDTGYSIIQTTDGGYIMAIGSWTVGEDNSDLVLMKIDNTGNIQWQKAYEGSDFDYFYSIIQADDGGYITVGVSKSYGTGDGDCWIIKTDANGNVLWQKAIGGVNYDYLFFVKENLNGNYISVGKTKSYGAGNSDILILEFDNSGKLIYQKVAGGVGDDEGYSIIEVSGGGYIIAGSSNSFGVGGADFIVLKMDETFSIENCDIVQNVLLSEVVSTANEINSSLSANSTNCTTNIINISSSMTFANANTTCPPKPILYSYKPSVNDENCEIPNGVIEPNETISLEGRLINRGTADATSISATLTTTSPIEILKADASYPDLQANEEGSCLSCYEIQAPLINRTGTHWDFDVTELSTCDLCNSYPFKFTFHVGNSFTDVLSSNIFYKFVETVLHYNITGGCTQELYCPASTVQRQHMAKFICRAMNAAQQESCVLNSCAGIFTDVLNSNLFCSDIEALYKIGIIAGCDTNPLRYCPNQNTNRAAMAKFICNAMQYIKTDSCPTYACEEIFDDVSSSNPFCSYIEALYKIGVISGCTETSYCPASYILRGQMAKFLVNAFNLDL